MKCIVDQRVPCCPFTLWANSYVKCYFDCRLGVFNLLIDDWIKFQKYDEFDPIEANNQFIRMYNAIPDRDVLFQNINEMPEELLERLNGRFPEVH